MIISQRKKIPNMNLRLTIPIVALTLLSSACSSNLTFSRIAPLQKKLTEEEVNKLVEIEATYEFTLHINADSSEYKVKSYTLSIGSYDSQFLFCFKNNKLLFWGYPHEFARANSPILNEIGEKSIAKIKQLEEL